MNIALVIIDMQNDFVLPEAPLCVKGAQATVPTIRKLLDRARAEGWRVIHVIRQHRRDGSDVEIGRAPLFTQGAGICVPGTKGAEIVDERNVTDSGGHTTKRPFIRTLVCLGGECWPIEINLTDRRHMLFPMLLGRTAMLGRLLIDPARSFVHGGFNEEEQ